MCNLGRGGGDEEEEEEERLDLGAAAVALDLGAYVMGERTAGLTNTEHWVK